MTNTRIEFLYGLKLVAGLALNSSTMFGFGYMVGKDVVRDEIRFKEKNKNKDNTI